MSLAAFHQPHIVESPCVSRLQLKRFLQSGARPIVFFPLDISEAHIHVAIFVVWPQPDDLLESSHGVGILLLVKKSYGDVVPAHPVLIVGGRRRSGIIRAHSYPTGA